MNTITKVDVQAEEPVIPANHPHAVFSKWHGQMLDEIETAIHPAVTKKTAPQLLTQARDIMEARAREYDKPDGERSVPAVVTALNAILGRDALSEAEGWLFLQLLKDVRLFSAHSYHADSGLDCISYAALKAEAKQRET